ncbi:MAG: hypothetical protein KBD01_13875 [Acidobacteria bacterium]|nr:hypothetical protein [Acidobacteriota bacterium]
MSKRRLVLVLVAAAVAALAGSTVAEAGNGLAKQRKKHNFSEQFFPLDCRFQDEGANTFFILDPGYQLVLEGDGEQVTITVLDQTELVDGVVTRVLEERETADGELAEVSRNYVAICEQTGDVYYFGEDVDNYEDGQVANHDGSWRAGEGENAAGVLMPGNPLLGARYYQELAPDIALDRAENLAVLDSFDVPAGEFETVLWVLETTPLEKKDKSVKYYAAGIGLIKDDDMELVRYGYVDR